MYFFNPFSFPFGLISADYLDYDQSQTYSQISEQVCNTFRERMKAYCEKIEIPFPEIFNDNESIIILWKNAPDPTNGKVALNKTIEMLCDPFNRVDLIYISSVSDIIGTDGIDAFIRFVSKLTLNSRKYVFLDNEYFSYKELSEQPPELTEFINKVSDNSFALTLVGTVINELEKLLPQNVPEPIDQFIEFYWKWQKADVAVDACKSDLGITHRTFYKYSALYETTPYYCEHLKILNHLSHMDNRINSYAKRGELPDKDTYLSDMQELESGFITADDICKKYNIASPIDINRIKLALLEGRRKAR